MMIKMNMLIRVQIGIKIEKKMLKLLILIHCNLLTIIKYQLDSLMNHGHHNFVFI